MLIIGGIISYWLEPPSLPAYRKNGTDASPAIIYAAHKQPNRIINHALWQWLNLSCELEQTLLRQRCSRANINVSGTPATGVTTLNDLKVFIPSPTNLSVTNNLAFQGWNRLRCKRAATVTDF